MDCDTNEPVAHKVHDEKFEVLPEGTVHLSLEPSELQSSADSACNSPAGEENVPLHSKVIGEPVGITCVADLESRQSPGSDSLVDVFNTRKESGVDGVESVDNKYDENEGTEEKVTEGTEELHSSVNKTVTDGIVISEKGSHKEYAELNVKEKDEHEEVYDKQKKETEDVSDKEKKDPEELNGEKEIEVVNNKEKETEEISNKQKNEIEVVADRKMKETEKMSVREKENGLNNEEKKDKEVPSNKEKEKVEEQSNSEKKSDVIEPEIDGGKGKHELEAIELSGCENKETPENKSEGETRITTSMAESDECEMDVDDPDPYPEHINFVDVNAPNCDSPMVIDDDDDDEIVMIERRKGTSQKGKTDKKDKAKTDISNRDSSPEVVLQEKLCRRRQEIVIDLDDDDDDVDDDIEIESIKKKKKNKSNAPRGACCCNVECSAPSQDLHSAPVFVLTYYGRKYRKGKPEKVCPLCFEAAMQHQEVCICMCSIVYLSISCQ